MKIFNRFIFAAILLMITFCTYNTSFARANDQIEVYKIGSNATTLKWTAYSTGGAPVSKYSIGYRASGAASYSNIDISSPFLAPDYNSVSNEFTKRIDSLSSGTIYDFKIDVYVQGNPSPVVFYKDIKVMTKIVIDKTVTSFQNPYGDDTIGHLDFAFTAPQEISGGTTVTVNNSNISGYNLVVSTSEGQIYSGGQPYKVLYDGIKYNIYRVTSSDVPLTYGTGTPVQFSFPSQTSGGKESLAFSLYKTNQPSADNFSLATIHYVLVQPIFKAGSSYENVIVDATARYETVETIATVLPLTVSQISNDLIKLEFQSAGTGSMTYDIYRGRQQNTLSKIHTEFDDGSRTYISYYNKIDNPIDGDVYWFKVIAGQTTGITSRARSVTISVNPSVAPVMQNIKIEKVIADSVKNSSDIILSWDKPITEDTYRSSLVYRVNINTSQSNQVMTADLIYDAGGSIARDVNGKIILNTKKDINNNNILYKGYPVVFERIAEIKPSEHLSDPSSVYSGNDPVGYFLQSGKNYYKIIRDGKEVVREIYRIKGADLLDTNLNLSAPAHTIYKSNSGLELQTDYKTKIELNTTYYLKMDSYNIPQNQISDYSLTVGFTTPTNLVQSVPVPSNFGVENIEAQKIELLWDRIDQDKYDPTKVNYEVYISDTDSYADNAFTQIINPVPGYADGKVTFTLDINYILSNSLIKTVIPNTVYLFKIRAAYSTFDANNNAVTVYSNLSEVLPVTTKRMDVPDPDMTAPPAPVDFAVSNVTSKTASFTWTKVDDFSTYRIVRTDSPIDPFAPTSQVGDGVWSGFAENNSVFSYSDASLSANTLYYFSIRSEVTVIINGQPQALFSPWVTIPVTTILVEAPTDLALVSRNPNGSAVTISWRGKANLNYEVVKKDDSMTNYAEAEGLTGDAANPEVKTFQITLTGLKSNTRYFIKVRAKDPDTGMYSKYSDPITIRTEFNQGDYDKEQDNRDKVNQITDITKEWNKLPIIKIGYDNSRLELFIKPDIARNSILNSYEDTYTISLEDENATANGIVYIPMDLVEALNNTKKNLEIVTHNSKFVFRPWTIEETQIEKMMDYSTIKSRFVKFRMAELNSFEASAIIPRGEYAASKVYDVTFNALALNKTYDELSKAIIDTVNNVINTEKDNVGTFSKSDLAKRIENVLKYEVKRVIDSSYIFEMPMELKDKTVRAELSYTPDNGGNYKNYVLFVQQSSSSKEIQGQIIDSRRARFETPVFGKMAVLGKKGPADAVSDSSSGSLDILISEYGFSNELIDGKFKPSNNTKLIDALSFVINVMDTRSTEKNDILKTASELGLTKDIPTWNAEGNITRQEYASILAKVYESKTGINAKDYKTLRSIKISDINDISPKYLSGIYLVLDNKIMSNFPQYMFYPGKTVTRGEAAEMLVNLLKSVGEIN